MLRKTYPCLWSSGTITFAYCWEVGLDRFFRCTQLRSTMLAFVPPHCETFSIAAVGVNTIVRVLDPVCKKKNVILCIIYSSLPFELMNSLRSNYQISLSHYSPDTNGIFMKGNILYVISRKHFYRANSWSICNVSAVLAKLGVGLVCERIPGLHPPVILCTLHVTVQYPFMYNSEPQGLTYGQKLS